MFRRLFPNLAKIGSEKLMALALLAVTAIGLLAGISFEIGVAMGWQTREPEIACADEVKIGEWPKCHVVR